MENEIANALYNLARDMDWGNEYEEEIKEDLENAIFWIKSASQNDLNPKYWLTLFNVLVALTETYNY